MSFKIGDKVRVKKSSTIDEKWHGKILTIKNVAEDNYYTVEEDSSIWDGYAFEPVVTLPTIKDSGERTEYNTGAVRDLKAGKGRCDLMPLDVIADYIKWFEGEATEMEFIFSAFYIFGTTGNYECLMKALEQFQAEKDFEIPEMLLELSKHYEEGALKYGEHNWEKGIPVHSYIDSAIRHYLKYKAGWNDEPHDRAFIWNVVCCIWTVKHKPELNDFIIKD